MDEMKKCPFCGSSDTRRMGLGGACNTCAADSFDHDWNNRPLEDALATEIAVLRDRLNAIHTAAEVINSTAWLTEVNQMRLDYVLEQADLTVRPPFTGKLSPEVQKFIEDAEAKHGTR